MKSVLKLQKTRSVSTSKPIRVLHVIDKLGVGGSSVHGVTQALSWWIPRFILSEFQFSVCSLRAPEQAREVLEREGIPLFFLSKGKFDPTTITSLYNLIKQERPHLLHLHGYGAANFGRIVSMICKIPNIVHEHVVIPKQPFYQTIADFILTRLTTKSIAVSKQVEEFMIVKRKVNPSQLETFAIGLPLKDFQASNQDILSEKRTELGISADENIVCMIGRLDTQKGQLYFLKAAAQILKQSPKTRFLIIGDGPDKTMLQNVAQNEGIVDSVVFAGYRRDIPDLISLSNIVAIPSLWEGGPLTLFEAMHLKKPVVGTPVGLMPDILQDGETGFLVPCQDVVSMAEKIVLLLKEPDLAHTMGEKAWETCQNFDISTSVQKLSRIYREFVA